MVACERIGHAHRLLVQERAAQCNGHDSTTWLTGSLISHEELLATLRQHSVSLFTLRPEFFHLWGAKMEAAWFGYVPRPRGLLHVLSGDSPGGKDPTAPFPLFLGRGSYLRNLPPYGPS